MSDFLAEARVIVRPDTTGFRALLEAQLAAATKKPLVVPVQAVMAPVKKASTTALTAVLTEQTLAQERAGAAAARAAALTSAQAKASTASATAAQKLALAYGAVANAVSPLGAAQVTATRSTAALAAASRAVELALRSEDKALITTTARTLALAEAQSLAATSALASAKSQAAHAASLASLQKAGIAGAAGLAGLRGAVLAANPGFIAGTVALVAFAKSVQAFASFEQELATFRVTAGATAEEMLRVSEQANRLGADVRLPAVSAADAAIAMTELAKAGLTVEEAMAGATGTLQLATAAQISNADAALIAANALNSFGLAGDQAVRVADVLANASNAAQGSITDFGLALRQSSAVARQVGLSLEDTTAILSLFAKNGLQGSDAGTSLRVALIRLIAPTQKAAAEIKKLGLDIRDAQGNVRADVFAQFGEATENLAPAMRDAAAAIIFGQDAIRAVSIGAREGTEGLRLMQFQIDQQGTAAEVAAARTEGLAGSLLALQSNVQTLSIQLGKVASGPLKDIAEGFSAMAATSTAAVGGIQKVENAIDKFLESLPGGKETNEFIDFFATPGRAFSESAKRINQMINGSDEASEKIRQLNDELQALQTARVEAERGGQSGVADRLTKEINALRDEIKALEEAGKGIDSGVTAPLQRALAEAEKVRDIRLDLDVDTTGIDRIIRSLKESIPITQHVEGNIERLRDDFGDLGSKARDGASGVDSLTRSLNELGRQAAQSQVELLRLQTEGGTPQQQIAVLQSSEQAQRAIIENIKSNGNQPGDATAIEQARNQIKSDQAEIAALQADIVADAKKAADKAEDARDEQDAQVRRLFEAVIAPVERLLARASLTEPLKDDIKFTEQLIAIYKNQIAQAVKRIKDVETRNQVLKVLGDKLFQAILDRKKLVRDERQRIRDALVDRIERIQTGIELDIELADINENESRQISLRQKLIAQIRKEIRVLKLTGNALKEKRNEIARINQEIEDIRGEQKKQGRSFQQMTFEFLQAQQGFAANLFGNLIPGGATGGLVGNVSPAASGGGTNIDLGIGRAIQQAEGRSQGGVSAGQGNSVIDILRRIEKGIRDLNRSSDAPEANRQRAVGSAAMDGAGGGTMDAAVL